MTNVGLSDRERRMNAQRDRIRKSRPQVETVHVEPTKDDYRPFLKHPNGAAFRETGGADWPNDRFTTRRLAEGSIKIITRPQHTSRQRAEG